MEVALLDAPILEGDLAIERRRNAEHDRALDLRLDRVGVDDSAAIDRADHAPHAHGTVLRHFDFGNLRHVGREDMLERHAAADSVREPLSPPGLFRGKRKDGLRTRRLVEEG